MYKDLVIFVDKKTRLQNSQKQSPTKHTTHMVIVSITLCLVHTVGKCACSDGWTGGLCEKS